MSVSLPDIALATCLLLITVTRLIFSRHSTPTADLSAQSPSHQAVPGQKNCCYIRDQ
jgi:hypothetical protein